MIHRGFLFIIFFFTLLSTSVCQHRNLAHVNSYGFTGQPWNTINWDNANYQYTATQFVDSIGRIKRNEGFNWYGNDVYEFYCPWTWDGSVNPISSSNKVLEFTYYANGLLDENIWVDSFSNTTFKHAYNSLGKCNKIEKTAGNSPGEWSIMDLDSIFYNNSDTIARRGYKSGTNGYELVREIIYTYGNGQLNNKEYTIHLNSITGQDTSFVILNKNYSYDTDSISFSVLNEFSDYNPMGLSSTLYGHNVCDSIDTDSFVYDSLGRLTAKLKNIIYDTTNGCGNLLFGHSLGTYYYYDSQNRLEEVRFGVFGSGAFFMAIYHQVKFQYTVTGLNDEKSNRLNAFPNPATNELNIVLNTDYEPEAILEIINLNGQKILIKDLTYIQNSVDISRLAPGLYFYNLSFNGKLLKGKFVKE